MSLRMGLGSGGGGGVDSKTTGPASSTDNAVARWDGTTGKLLQDSVVGIDDTTGLINIGLGGSVAADTLVTFGKGSGAFAGYARVDSHYGLNLPHGSFLSFTNAAGTSFTNVLTLSGTTSSFFSNLGSILIYSTATNALIQLMMANAVRAGIAVHNTNETIGIGTNIFDQFVSVHDTRATTGDTVFGFRDGAARGARLRWGNTSGTYDVGFAHDASGHLTLNDGSTTFTGATTLRDLTMRALRAQRPVSVKTGAYSVTERESNTLFTNEGATASVPFTLPAAAAQLTYSFFVQDADGLSVIAASGDTIRIGASVSAAAGNVASTTVGSLVWLTAINATEWIAESSSGTWVVT